MRKTKLKDICLLITKGTTPTTLGYNFTQTGINFIKVESFLDGSNLDESKFAFIDESTNEKLKRSKLFEYDILVSIAGVYLGKTAFITKKYLPANTRQATGTLSHGTGNSHGNYRLNTPKARKQRIIWYRGPPVGYHRRGYC